MQRGNHTKKGYTQNTLGRKSPSKLKSEKKEEKTNKIKTTLK
jgi:hypothetical protein